MGPCRAAGRSGRLQTHRLIHLPPITFSQRRPEGEGDEGEGGEGDGGEGEGGGGEGGEGTIGDTWGGGGGGGSSNTPPVLDSF